jgi:hypothetical protein
MRVSICSVLALLILSPAINHSESLSGATPVTFTTIGRGDSSGIEDRREVVVRTQAEWKKLWQEHAPNQPLPSVDFAKSMVVGIFAGSRNTGGHEIAIASIEKTGSDLVVTWRESSPGRRDIVTQMLTFPHHLVRFERIEGAVKFVKGGP